MSASPFFQRLAHFSLLVSLFMAINVSSAISFQKASSDFSSRTSFNPAQSGSYFSSASSFTPSASTLTLELSSPLASSVPTLRRSFLYMGKGDGKKKRPKKKKLAAPSMEAAPLMPPPQRVSTDINIPVKHQIRWAQMHKKAKQSAGQSFRQKKVERTSYRRTWDVEEIEIKKEERKRKGQDVNWDVVLNTTASQPLVIVDGYNIIYKWPRLKKHMVRGDTKRARQLLVDDLESLRVLKGWRIECVFDGAGKSSVGPLGHGPGGLQNTRVDRSASKDVSKHGVRVVYTGQTVEADSYIEKRCSDAKNITHGELTRSLIVATDDGMIKLAGQSAGAMCMSATRFVDELKAVKRSTQYRVEVAMAQVNGHAIRPEKLHGSHVHLSTFGRNSMLIEDKRNRTKKTRLKDIELLPEDMVNVTLDEDENGVPWWAQRPNATRFKND